MFEWDENKNCRNQERHGIAFENILSMFFSQNVLITEDLRKDYGERRFILLGPYEGVYLHITFTRRGENIRLISARRANRRERRDYEQRKNH